MRRNQAGSDDRVKREDLAALLPIFGIILLAPIVANLFLTRSSVSGLPLDLLYLFAVWIFLILGAMWLSCRLPEITHPVEKTPDLENSPVDTEET
ncbi:hypothetical protein GCM10011385_16050 [Nitratireductor aestuarii]|uniref:DUF3311 domain-containing protein n=1 Tax=Nitratireductor aestuarii TaxID=1735103 RepID=A0A916RMU1_9HYPH|nr:hypothetical protein [Nitratireductor aestuarii]GGA63055.1 hypothetical protein GCM10011385_16050 [Nitratireductor aestuarii]